jgi:high affinity Mn2+ porin
VRQTIDLGGETQKLESGINQFAGSQTADRLVITIGKFGAPDIFDTNRYAHDPRNDFMNWSVVDTGAWDYAADAWGYTYGAAVEWYQGRWTLRGGVFDLPITPNNTDLDPVSSRSNGWAKSSTATSCGDSRGKSRSPDSSPGAAWAASPMLFNWRR